MRLIDADELKRQIESALKKQKARVCDLVKVSELPILIDRQETAHDVEKVVERLEEIREEILTDTVYENDVVNHYLNYADLMIEIVKSGGANE